MAFKPENMKGSNTGREEPLPCVSPTEAPEVPRRVNLTERSWPFVGSFALHAVLFEVLFFPVLPSPNVVSSLTPTVLWFSPFIAPGDSDHPASLLNQPAVAFARQPETTESVAADKPEDAIEGDHPTAQPVSVPTSAAETGDTPAKADSGVIPPPPDVQSEADLIAVSPAPALRRIRPPSAPLVVPASEPPHKQLQPPAAEPPGIVPAEKRQADRERSERQEELERLARELAAQKLVLAENARQEQRARRQAQQALFEQSERERVAAETIRQEHEAQEKLQKEQRILEEQARLAAERTRQALRDREQEQQALREQAELKRSAAVKARQEREAHEQSLRERMLLEQQERLAAERTRQAQKAREQEQQALRELAERKYAAAEKSRQERERQEQSLRERELQEEAARRKERERAVEQSLRRPLAVAAKQQANPAPKAAENKSGHSPEKHSQKGLSFPLLKGDLKMVLTGAALPKVTITFKEFALTRRNRPFSRAEARREATITPLVAATQEKTREVVIEKVRAGVYSVTVEPVDGASEFACLLKLHEDSSRSTVRDCGRHTLAQKKVLVKILMPEGILWDDNKSFTGSMEDSDSVTKFNAETGLTWKEYSD